MRQCIAGAHGKLTVEKMIFYCCWKNSGESWQYFKILAWQIFSQKSLLLLLNSKKCFKSDFLHIFVWPQKGGLAGTNNLLRPCQLNHELPPIDIGRFIFPSSDSMVHQTKKISSQIRIALCTKKVFETRFLGWEECELTDINCPASCFKISCSTKLWSDGLKNLASDIDFTVSLNP